MNKLVVEESELRELDEAKRKAKLLNEGHELDDEEATGIGAVSFSIFIAICVFRLLYFDYNYCNFIVMKLQYLQIVDYKNSKIEFIFFPA